MIYTLGGYTSQDHTFLAGGRFEVDYNNLGVAAPNEWANKALGTLTRRVESVKSLLGTVAPNKAPSGRITSRMRRARRPPPAVGAARRQRCVSPSRHTTLTNKHERQRRRGFRLGLPWRSNPV